MNRNEHGEQVAVINWARMNTYVWPELRWLYSVPNGARLTFRYDSRGTRYSVEAERLKAEGMVPGVSDLVLPVARGGWFGLYLEMKAGRNTLSDDQERFLEFVTEQGYMGIACWGADDAIQNIRKYLRMQRTYVLERQRLDGKLEKIG